MLKHLLDLKLHCDNCHCDNLKLTSIILIKNYRPSIYSSLYFSTYPMLYPDRKAPMAAKNATKET